jgi:hypothetical protein
MFDECSINHCQYRLNNVALAFESNIRRVVSSDGITEDSWGADAMCADPTVGLTTKRNLGSTFPLSAD